MTTSLSPRTAPVHPTRQQLDELDALLQRMLDLPVNQVDDPGPSEESEPPTPEYRTPVSYKVPIAEPPPRLEPRLVPVEEPVRTPPPPAAPPPAPPRAEAREPGPDDWVRLASTWQPSAQTWQPLAQSWQQAARTADTPAAPPPPAVEAPLPAHQATNRRAPAVMPESPAPIAPRPIPVAPPRQPRTASSWSTFANAPEPTAPESIAPEPVALATEPVPSRAIEETEDFAALRSGPAKAIPEPSPQLALPKPRYSLWQWPFLPANVVFDVVTLPLGPLGAGLRSRIGRNLLAALGVVCLLAAITLVVADAIGWIW